MGVLSGLRIIELAGIGPAPFCGMMLADHGAKVIRVERIGAPSVPTDTLARSRCSLCINLKSVEGVAIVRALVKQSDAFIEGFRPGVIERLGLGPDVLLSDNPNIVIGRMTGWGQHGTYASAAGHDINYIALSGILHTCRRKSGQPQFPANYLGDFGGGGMLLAFGIVSALLAVRNGAPGQVIDCAITDGSALLMAMTWAYHAQGRWQDRPGVNMLDGGAPYYDTFETRDGEWVSIGSIEPKFFALLCEKLEVTEDPAFEQRDDPCHWPYLKERLRQIFLTKTRQEWCSLLEGSDVCFAPVLSLADAPRHPHNVMRGTYLRVAEAIQPAPAPRYSRTPSARPEPAPVAGADTVEILLSLGFGRSQIDDLTKSGVVA